jgi:hypothetical protein
MSKGKANGKGKTVVSAGEMNKQAFLDETSSFIASLANEEIAPQVCTALGMEYVNNSVANEVIRYIIGSSAESYFRHHSDAALAGPGERTGRAVRREASRDLLHAAGIGFDFFDDLIKGLMQNKEFVEADTQTAAEEAANVRMSERKPASVDTEPEVEAMPEPKVMVSDKKINEPGKVRFFGAFDDIKSVTAIYHLLENGTPDILPAIKPTHPVGCQGIDCGIMLEKYENLYVGTDAVSGKSGFFCKKCLASIEEQNALFADGEDAKAGLSKEKTVSFTEAELLAWREEYERLSANEAKANEHATKLTKEADSKLTYLEKTEGEVAKLQKAVDAGLEDFTDDLAKVKTDLVAQEQEATEAITSVEAAKDALNRVREDRVKFSERHAPHMNLIIAGREGPINDELATKLTNIGKPASEATKTDPYPNLKPKDICGCGTGSREYKNCCGRQAFCNPKDGKVRKAKKGDIRVSEYKARKA